MKKILICMIFILLPVSLWASAGCLCNKSPRNQYARCGCPCTRIVNDHNKCLDCSHYHEATAQKMLSNAYEEYKQYKDAHTQPYHQCWDEIKAFEAQAHAQKKCDKTS